MLLTGGVAGEFVLLRKSLRESSTLINEVPSEPTIVAIQQLSVLHAFTAPVFKSSA